MSRLRYVIPFDKEKDMLSDQITYIKTNKITDYISPGRITCLVGGGGKTSSMLQIARELAGEESSDSTNTSHTVIMTTTTHIKPFEESLPSGVRCVGVKNEKGKLGAVEDPDALKKQCDYLLIEADGSRGLPVKVPAAYEPVITAKTDLVIAVMGLTGIGRPIREVCHRIPLVCAFLNKKETDLLTEEDASKILLSEVGLKKGVCHRRYAIILNQADNESLIEKGRKIQSYLPDDLLSIMTSYEL